MLNYDGKGIWSRKIIVTIIVLICILSTSFFTVSANSKEIEKSKGKGGEIGKDHIILIEDEAVSNDDDKFFEYLKLDLQINITESDKYTLLAILILSEINIRAFADINFEPGIQEITLRFNDTYQIYESNLDGPYSVELMIYKGKGEEFVKIKYKTNDYKFINFNPTPPTNIDDYVLLAVVNNTIKLETNTFVAIIYELTPMIIFYYKSDEGVTSRFKITYDLIIGFRDENNDGMFQSDELEYWGNLLESFWSSPKTLMESFNNFDFRVQTIVDLVDKNGEPVNTSIGLTFYYSSLTKAMDPAAARKFDIKMKILGDPLENIDYLTIKHTLIDEMSNHKFNPVSQQNEDKISFITNDNKEHGYYSWKDSVKRTSHQGQIDNKIVTYNLENTNEQNSVILYLNYLYTPEISELYHDPVVGVNPENAPKLPGEATPEIISHGQWFIIYIVVAIVATIIILGNIYRQRKKREYD